MNRKTKELNRSNNALDQQISPENREAFTDMICYLRGAKISAYLTSLQQGGALAPPWFYYAAKSEGLVVISL